MYTQIILKNIHLTNIKKFVFYKHNNDKFIIT